MAKHDSFQHQPTEMIRCPRVFKEWVKYLIRHIDEDPRLTQKISKIVDKNKGTIMNKPIDQLTKEDIALAINAGAEYCANPDMSLGEARKALVGDVWGYNKWTDLTTARASRYNGTRKFNAFGESHRPEG